MGGQNEASPQGSYDSTLEEMAKFDFNDEESIIRTIIFENENDEPILKSKSLTTAEDTLHNTNSISDIRMFAFDDIDAQINVNLIHKNGHYNDTGQNESQAKENCQLTNHTNTNAVQTFSNLPCISKTFENTKIDTSKRKNADPILQDCEPIKQKTNFPRTKFTSRRLVKKFPGKMDSMKKHQQVSKQNSPVTVEESIEDSDNIDRLAISSGRNTESEQRLMAALKIVADNLIHISPYMNRYAKISQFRDSNEFRLASNAFKNAKNHYFALSYSTAASTIFPYRNDPKYMRMFYNIVFQITNQRGIPNTFSEKSLEILCSEMLNWTEMKMSKSKKDEMRLMQAANPTILTDKNSTTASTNDINSMNTSAGTANKTSGDITLVFPADHMNSAIKISYNPALTSQLSTPSQSCTNVSSNMTTEINSNAPKYPGQPHPQRYVQCVQQQQQTPAIFNHENVNCNNQQEMQQRLQPMPHLQPSAMPANVILQNPLSSIRIERCYQVPSSPQKRNIPESQIPNRSEQFNSSPGQHPQTDMSSQALSFAQQQESNMSSQRTLSYAQQQTLDMPAQRTLSYVQQRQSDMSSQRTLSYAQQQQTDMSSQRALSYAQQQQTDISSQRTLSYAQQQQTDMSSQRTHRYAQQQQSDMSSQRIPSYAQQQQTDMSSQRALSYAQQQQTDMLSLRTLSYAQQQNQLDQSEMHQRNFLRLNNYPQERSTSRDSGFFSPVQDACQQESLLPSPTRITLQSPGLPPPPPYPYQPYQQPQREPQANLKRLPEKFGSCVVCKNVAYLVCLGCSNTFYCGATCQNIDWKYHAKDCKRNT